VLQKLFCARRYRVRSKEMSCPLDRPEEGHNVGYAAESEKISCLFGCVPGHNSGWGRLVDFIVQTTGGTMGAAFGR